jgi:hypothetical protein
MRPPRASPIKIGVLLGPVEPADPPGTDVGAALETGVELTAGLAVGCGEGVAAAGVGLAVWAVVGAAVTFRVGAGFLVEIGGFVT